LRQDNAKADQVNENGQKNNEDGGAPLHETKTGSNKARANWNANDIARVYLRMLLSQVEGRRRPV
jgi:hypothetical protein